MAAGAAGPRAEAPGFEDVHLLQSEEGHSFSFSLEKDDTVEVAEKVAPPLWTWILLGAAVCAVSSAGVVFALMAEVPALTMAAWRLQLSGLLLVVCAAIQVLQMPGGREARREAFREWHLTLASGSFLAVHFGFWLVAVRSTSLAHALLFVSSTPIILALGAWALRKPISRGELSGTALGAAGAVLLATAASSQDEEASWQGDTCALIASAIFIGYLLLGQHLRKWMPVFVYAASVTTFAAVLLTLAAWVAEGARWVGTGPDRLFGWVGSPTHLPYILYLAVVPGLIGHTGFNTVIKYHSPLVICLACNMEPLIGSLMGWIAGVVPPGLWTWLGGALVVVSTAVVTLSQHYRERQEHAAAVQQQAIAAVLRSAPGVAPATRLASDYSLDSDR